MRRALVIAVLVLILAGAGTAALWTWPIGAAVRLNAEAGDPQRGAYLARMAGCIACHTDAEGDGAPLAGGLELNTRFGSFYSPNLTTDEGEGIGAWSVEQFARAVRQGVSPEGEPYYPAFPYPFYAKFSDQDIADLWAAFRTVPAADRQSNPHDLNFPFNFRPLLKVWRSLFLQAPPVRADAQKGEAWNRGAFIVNGPAHCGACHTPRNFFGARDVEQVMHGSDDLPDGEKAPPITAEALREGGWTESDLAYALKTGVTPEGDAFGGAMGEVVLDGTSFLTDEDLEAIATYLLNREHE